MPACDLPHHGEQASTTAICSAGDEGRSEPPHTVSAMPISLLSAPTNLGLRPPVATATPGCAKAPEVLRAAGLYARLDAADAGLVVCPRYVDDALPGRLRNQDAILDYSTRLADRLGALIVSGQRPLVLGGDCSLLLGVGLVLRRLGRYGLVHVDGHTDFRHPGNSAQCASLAGEDLAAAVGLHGLVVPASQVRRDGVQAAPILDVVARAGLDGYWLHVDIDVLDEAVMPAVDSPSPGGLMPAQLIALLRALAPGAVGAHVGIYDPDLDPDGSAAEIVVDCIADGLADLGAAR